MNIRQHIKLVAILLILPCVYCFSAEENFLLINGLTDEVALELGTENDTRFTPCSSFKITLSLMGYDGGVLTDAEVPIWDFQEGHDDYLDSWKRAQTPLSWMKYSCLWFSKVLAEKLGREKIQSYLNVIDYGNGDISGGTEFPFWVNSSLKVSVREQVGFLKKMITGKLPISTDAVEATKKLLFIEELHNGWKLFGKTGWSGSKTNDLEIGWFVGWIEKEDIIFPFAYNIRDKKITLDQRRPRVEQLLTEVVIKELKTP